MDDLVYVLTRNSLIEPSDVNAFRSAEGFIALHILTTMHGSTILLADGSRANLAAGFDNQERRLEVKADLRFEISGKEVRMPFCLFWTSLEADEHCDPDLLAKGPPWALPLEIEKGKLAAIS